MFFFLCVFLTTRQAQNEALLLEARCRELEAELDEARRALQASEAALKAATVLVFSLFLSISPFSIWLCCVTSLCLRTCRRSGRADWNGVSQRWRTLSASRPIRSSS